MFTGEDKGAVTIMGKYSFIALKNPGAGWSWGEKNYGVQGTPTSFLLDPDGRIVFNVPGLETLPAVKQAESEVAGLVRWTESPGYKEAESKSPPSLPAPTGKNAGREVR
jgi:hypothetical protein